MTNKYRIVTLPFVGVAIGVAAGGLVVLLCRVLGIHLSPLQEKVSFFGFSGIGLAMGLTDFISWLIFRCKSQGKEPDSS